MPIEFSCLQKSNLNITSDFESVKLLADEFLDYLRQPEIEQKIESVHKIGASSSEVQAAILPGALKLGFSSEKKGLFDKYAVSALRPDYYKKLGNSGVLLEVERGKTTMNNMDLLDFWKCHICEHANFLFLLVPLQRPSKNGKFIPQFNQVKNRLSTFFTPQNYVNVESVFLFGY